MSTRPAGTTTGATASAHPARRQRQAAARDPVRSLRDAGGSYRAIAAAAGVAPMTVYDTAAGRRRPNRGTTAAVLAVTSGDLRQARVDAGGARSGERRVG